MRIPFRKKYSIGLLCILTIAGEPLFAEEAQYCCAEADYPSNVYWGDLHVHTNLSVDAFQYGNKILDADSAYRFAKGEALKAHNGTTAQLPRPLDFLAVTDHAFNLGLLLNLEIADPAALGTESGRLLYQKWQRIRSVSDPVTQRREARKFLDEKLFPQKGNREAITDLPYKQHVWKRITSAAEKHNDPGKFTAFIGYEWSSMDTISIGDGSIVLPSTIHRNVIFKDGADKADQTIPFSAFDSKNPKDLWKYLEDYEESTGGEVLAIPHNGNLSSGQMFSVVDFSNRPLSRNYAELRNRWEPLYEVTQIKGDSETHPVLSPDDEFADYETWNGYDGAPAVGIRRDWKRYEYARSALKLGLDQQAKLGVNPFQFGMIGSTDAHTALATADEYNFFGKTTTEEPSPERLAPKLWDRPWELSASGYTGIWAQENTRASLFAAMKRKEVYASTGPRMTVRFFGGWDYSEDDAYRPDLARIGYAKGVPMGGNLTNAPEGLAPSFLIRAVKDPDGANLDRIQVVKGWRSEDGNLHEKVYDVALSDGREIRKNQRPERVGSTVDVKGASYTNAIGDPELAVVWSDPDFDQNEFSFYYVRVIEIPTPRWTAYDARYFGISLNDLPDEITMATQERAYTSPIWYFP